MILVDTNVLVYALNRDAPQHRASRGLIEAVRQREIEAAVTPQVLLEFFAVITDRRRIERPLDYVTAWQEMEKFRAIFRVLDPGLAALDRLAGLVASTGTTGPSVFDAWLAAQMLACGVHIICTYNVDDFSHFSGVTASKPEELLAG